MDRKKIIASLQTPKAVKWFWIIVMAPFALLLFLLLLTAVGLFGKLPFYFLKSINFTITDHIAFTKLEGLHTGWHQAHNRQSVKTKKTISCIYYPAVIRSAGNRAVKSRFKGFQRSAASAITHNRTHGNHLNYMRNSKSA